MEVICPDWLSTVSVRRILRGRPQLTWGIEVDPISNHAPPPKPVRYKAKKPTPATTSTTTSESTFKSSTSRKRLPDGSGTASQRATKKPKKKFDASHQVFDEEDEDSTPKPETQHQLDPAFQVCRYLLEMFSVPLLRSHATVSLVDRDRLQLYHANHSVILVSSAINFSEGDGLDKFIANVITFYRLSFRQNGILDTFSGDNAELVKNPYIPEDNKVVQRGNTLKFLGGDSPEFTVTLGEVISHDPATVGRSTVVLGAASDHWSTPNLVIKISWPGSGRVLETLGAKGHLPRGYIEDTLRFFKQFTQKVSRGYMLSSFTMYPPL